MFGTALAQLIRVKSELNPPNAARQTRVCGTPVAQKAEVSTTQEEIAVSDVRAVLAFKRRASGASSPKQGLRPSKLHVDWFS